jgi:hypothetical protein
MLWHPPVASPGARRIDTNRLCRGKARLGMMRMSSANPFEDDDACSVPAWVHPPSPRRGLVFLLLGPMLGVLIALVPHAASGGFSVGPAFIGDILFLFGLLVCGIAGVIDGILSRTLPIALRAPLIALVGAMIAIGLPAALLGPPPAELSIALGIGGALCTGVCSLLSHDYRRAGSMPVK